VRRFGFKEVEAATNGFTAVVAGGAAYRARFAGGLVATVRRASAGEGRGREDFYREVQLLGRLNHRHVVRLHGFSEGRHHHNRSAASLLMFAMIHSVAAFGVLVSFFLKKDLVLW
jgi:serine/threonine protein kinase